MSINKSPCPVEHGDNGGEEYEDTRPVRPISVVPDSPSEEIPHNHQITNPAPIATCKKLEKHRDTVLEASSEFSAIMATSKWADPESQNDILKVNSQYLSIVRRLSKIHMQESKHINSCLLERAVPVPPQSGRSMDIIEGEFPDSSLRSVARRHSQT